MSEEFVNPLDSMPIATNGSNKYAPPEKMKDLDPNPRPEEEVADWFKPKKYSSRHESTPEFEKSAEEVVTMHEKAYRIATAKYNPFAVGGSETLGGSENASSI